MRNGKFTFNLKLVTQPSTSNRNKYTANYIKAGIITSSLVNNYANIYGKENNPRKARGNDNIIANIKNKEEKPREYLKRTAISLSPKKNNEQNQICLLPQRTKNSDMKTIVLDLDETLVHSTFDEIDNPDLIIQMQIDEMIYDIYVMIRPGAFEFIEELAKIYEVVIFTASMSKYADPLITKLDVNKRCHYRLFREHCTYMDGVYVKDMARMGRNLRNLIIVDNSPLSYSLQPHNGIPIKSWFEDKEDRELFRLLPILRNLSGFYDVRTEIPKFVTNNTLIWARAIRWVEENYILVSYTDDIESLKISDRTVNSVNASQKESGYRMNNYTKKNSEEESNCTQTIIHESENSENKSHLINNNNKQAIHYQNSNQSFQHYKQIINRPNININIINGSYNKIVLTDGDEVNESDKYDKNLKSHFRKINTEGNSPQKDALQSPTQNIISDLKSYNDIINKQISPKKTGLHYNLYNRRKSKETNETANNILDNHIPKDSNRNLQKENKSIKADYKGLVDSRYESLGETTDNIIYERGILTAPSSNMNTGQRNCNIEKDSQSNFNQNLKKEIKNSLNLYKVKTNFSTFLKNNGNLYNSEKPKYSNYTSNISNINNSYQKSTSNQSFLNLNTKSNFLTNKNGNGQGNIHITDNFESEGAVNDYPNKTRNYKNMNNNTRTNSKLNFTKMSTNSNLNKSKEKNPSVNFNTSLGSNMKINKIPPNNKNRKSSILRHSYNITVKNDSLKGGDTYYLKTESDINEPTTQKSVHINPISLTRNTKTSASITSTLSKNIINNYPDYTKVTSKIVNLKYPSQNNTKTNNINLNNLSNNINLMKLKQIGTHKLISGARAQSS